LVYQKTWTKEVGEILAMFYSYDLQVERDAFTYNTVEIPYYQSTRFKKQPEGIVSVAVGEDGSTAFHLSIRTGYLDRRRAYCF